jgi:hypothetical protein
MPLGLEGANSEPDPFVLRILPIDQPKNDAGVEQINH